MPQSLDTFTASTDTLSCTCALSSYHASLHNKPALIATSHHVNCTTSAAVSHPFLPCLTSPLLSRL